MKGFFGTDLYGKRSVVSHYDHCGSCHKLAALSSYTTVRFFNLRKFPLIQIGRPVHVMDECPYCGNRIIISNRKYRKKRKEDLAVMMDGFASRGDDPYTAMNGLQTLMVYNEESWFGDVMHSYGKRFDTHMVVQLLLAQGLCRFGHYSEAEAYARKAIVLGAGPHADELLAFCQAQLEKKEAGHLELGFLPESILRPYAFMMAVVACLFMGLMVGISSTRNHTAWLVNGLHESYSVEIDGTSYRLRPYGLKRIKLRLGKHQMQTHEVPGHTAAVLFNYKISLLKQRFGDHVLVLNPDAIAVMVEETLIEGQTTNRYMFGKVVNELKGINYPFSDFPVWVGSKNSAQTRLFNHKPTSLVEMVEFLRAHGDPDDAAVYARRVLMTNPSGAESENLIKIAIGDLTTDQTIAFLQRGKSILPPLPVWHCFYQDFMGIRQPGHDLQNEYATLCKTHPDIPEYYYLFGRVAQKRTSAKFLFEKSEEGSGSHGMGYHAIARDLLCSGQFKEAQSYSKKALEQSPDHPGFQEIDHQICLALRQYEHPLQQVQTKIESDPGNGEWIAEKIKYLILLGEHRAATETINSFPDIRGWNAYFRAARFYAVGNTTGYLENLLESGRGDAKLQQLLHTGEVEAAHNLFSKNEDHEYTESLVVYCAAKYHGFPEIAKIERVKAIAECGKSTPVHREVSATLTGETPPSIKQLLDLRIMPAEKAILCTALGFKFPAQQKSFFNLARKLNYTPEYPQLLLKKWTRNPALRH